MPQLEHLRVHLVDEEDYILAEYGRQQGLDDERPLGCYVESKTDQRFKVCMWPLEPLQIHEIVDEAQRLGVDAIKWTCCGCARENPSEMTAECFNCGHPHCDWCRAMSYYFARMSGTHAQGNKRVVGFERPLLPPYDYDVSIYLDGRLEPEVTRPLYLSLIQNVNYTGPKTMSGVLVKDENNNLTREPWYFRDLSIDHLGALLKRVGLDFNDNEQELTQAMLALDIADGIASLGEIKVEVTRVVHRASRSNDWETANWTNANRAPVDTTHAPDDISHVVERPTSAIETVHADASAVLLTETVPFDPTE